MNNIIIILNNLKEFLQEKVSHLFYGLEVSINCNVSLYVYSTQTVI